MLWSPLELSIHIRNYSFGERLIEELLRKPNLPPGVIAETWEISDYRDAPPPKSCAVHWRDNR
ncbi:MAG: hypothetical protein R2843_04760 [Thermomicrobiales bacterium]